MKDDNAMEKYCEAGFINGVITFANYLKNHSCSYDLDNYHSFDAIDIENLNNLVNEFLSENNIYE